MKKKFSKWMFGERGSAWHTGNWKYVFGGAFLLFLILAISCGSPPPDTGV